MEGKSPTNPGSFVTLWDSIAPLTSAKDARTHTIENIIFLGSNNATNCAAANNNSPSPPARERNSQYKTGTIKFDTMQILAFAMCNCNGKHAIRKKNSKIVYYYWQPSTICIATSNTSPSSAQCLQPRSDFNRQRIPSVALYSARGRRWALQFNSCATATLP